MMYLFGPIEKHNSALPLRAPFRSREFPDNSARKSPKSANSIACSIVLFPQPMSPDSMTMPVGNSIRAFV